MRRARIQSAAAVIAACVLSAPGPRCRRDVRGLARAPVPTTRSPPTDGWAPFDSGRSRIAAETNARAPSYPRRLASALAANTTHREHGEYVGWSFTAPPATTICELHAVAHACAPAHGYDGVALLGARVLPPGGRACPVRLAVRRRGLRRVLRPQPVRGARQSGVPRSGANRISRQQRGGQAPDRDDGVHRDQRPSCPTAREPRVFEIYAARIGALRSARARVHACRRPARCSTPTLRSRASKLDQVRGHATRAAASRGSGSSSTADSRSRAPLEHPTSPRCAQPIYRHRSLPAAAPTTTLAFDTATLPNGPHAIQASVTDAAGNETRSDPVVVTTRNGSRPNGRGASRFVKLAAWLRSRTAKQRASAVVPYGSVRTAEGRLTDAEGKPIGGAVLDVVSNVDRPGAKDKRAGTVTTRDDGRFSYRIGVGRRGSCGSSTRRTRSIPRRSRARRSRSGSGPASA